MVVSTATTNHDFYLLEGVSRCKFIIFSDRQNPGKRHLLTHKNSSKNHFEIEHRLIFGAFYVKILSKNPHPNYSFANCVFACLQRGLRGRLCKNISKFKCFLC
jgi:hypothetical protein